MLETRSFLPPQVTASSGNQFFLLTNQLFAPAIIPSLRGILIHARTAAATFPIEVR